MQTAAQIDVVVRCCRCRQRAFLSGHSATFLPVRATHQFRPPVQALATIARAHEVPSLTTAACTAERTGRIAVVRCAHIDRVPAVGINRVTEHIATVVPAEPVTDIQLRTIGKSSGSIGIGIRIIGQPEPCAGCGSIGPPVLQVRAVNAVFSVETEPYEHLPAMYACCGIHTRKQRRSTEVLPTVSSRRVTPHIVRTRAFAVPAGKNVRLVTHNKTSSACSPLRHSSALVYTE